MNVNQETRVGEDSLLPTFYMYMNSLRLSITTKILHVWHTATRLNLVEPCSIGQG